MTGRPGTCHNAAEGFRSTVQKAVELVSFFPDAGPRYLYGTRRVVMTDYPYLLVYRVRGDILQVIAIAHTSRRPGYWRDRLD